MYLLSLPMILRENRMRMVKKSSVRIFKLEPKLLKEVARIIMINKRII